LAGISIDKNQKELDRTPKVALIRDGNYNVKNGGPK